MAEKVEKLKYEAQKPEKVKLELIKTENNVCLD